MQEHWLERYIPPAPISHPSGHLIELHSSRQKVPQSFALPGLLNVYFLALAASIVMNADNIKRRMKQTDKKRIFTGSI